MGDPLSAVTSIIAVIQISGKVLAVCHQYTVSVKNASRDVQWVINEVGSLKVILKELKRLQTPASSYSALSKSLDATNGPLKTCEAALEKLLGELSTRGTTTGMLTWPLKKETVQRILETIQKQKSNLILALAADETRAIAGMEEAMSQNAEILSQTFDTVTQNLEMTLAIRDDLESTKERQYREKISRWLSSTDSFTNHIAARKVHEAYTGEWLLGTSEYLAWRKGEGRFVWLNGLSGCGKTMFTSSVVEDVRRYVLTSPGVLLAYYYFDFNQTAKQQSGSMAQSLLWQIFNELSTLPAAVTKLYENYANGARQPDWEAVMDILIPIIQSQSKLYIILDALDECLEPEILFDMIDRLHSTCTNCYLFVSSRREHDISETLSKLAPYDIKASNASVDEDIKIYLQRALTTDTVLKAWPEPMRLRCEEALISRSDGM